jgi:hypothetical protein
MSDCIKIIANDKPLCMIMTSSHRSCRDSSDTVDQRFLRHQCLDSIGFSLLNVKRHDLSHAIIEAFKLMHSEANVN